MVAAHWIGALLGLGLGYCVILACWYVTSRQENARKNLDRLGDIG